MLLQDGQGTDIGSTNFRRLDGTCAAPIARHDSFDEVVWSPPSESSAATGRK